MKSSAIWVLVLSLCSFNAAYALRCKHEVIMPGDYKGDVLALCGEPESVETRTAIVGSTLRFPLGTLNIQQFEEIKIEEWIYNFGPYRLQQYLRFENGKLTEISTLGRGY